MKKIIVYLTIFSLLNLAGCYYQEQMNPEEYKFDENADLQVTTKDTTYTIIGKDYYYKSDTLFAKISVQLDKRTSGKQKVNIPVDDIATVEVERIDALATTLVLAGFLAVTIAIIVAALTGSGGGTTYVHYEPHGL